MSHPPPSSPKPPAPPAAPGGAPAPKPGQDRLESTDRNVFTQNRKTDFVPTPLKPRVGTGEVSSNSLRVPPPRPPTSARSGAPTSATGERPTFMMPGAPSPAGSTPPQKTGEKTTPGAAKPGPPQKPGGQRTASSASMPGAPSQPQKPTVPGQKPATPGAPGGSGQPQKPGGVLGRAAAASAAKAAPKAPPKPVGLITSGDTLAYQGKLPVFVGKPVDGNPMVDAEDAQFVFDPAGKRVQLSCKVAAIMLKAACLHLGLPPPDRGPRRFQVHGMLRPEVAQKHHQKLFDGNLEVRLQALEEGRPVLLDLTLYDKLQILPDT